jgi:predicted metal-binding membrane protein
MSAFRIAVPASVERGGIVAAVGFVAAAAWVVLASADANVHSVLHVHGRPDLAAPFHLTSILLFVAAWTGMSVAMMLPTSLPVLTVLHTFASERADRWMLIALAATGYLAAWVAVGALVGPFSLAVQSMTVLPVQPGSADRFVLPALLLLAGLFQFSALKYRCLEKCRSPLNFVLSHWRGERQRWHAFRLGWASGVFCVGCCWALMLLMLVSSVQHLALMLLLGLVMAVEKNVRWGRRLSAPLGIVLILCAVVVFVAGGDLGRLSRAIPEFCGATQG